MVELFGPVGRAFPNRHVKVSFLLNIQEIRSMPYRASLPVAVMVALVILTGGIAAQTKKSKAKKRNTHRATQTTVVQEAVPTPVEIPASVPTPTPTPAIQTPGDGVRRITPAEAREAVDKGKAIIIDVRGDASYNAGHIKGARSISVNDIGSRTSELPRDKMIITYCS
jgi:3-mercaptopyruvate sulfurtransferase SseA